MALIMKTLLPTSTAGSLPKPSWLAQPPETLWSPWKLEGEELIVVNTMPCVSRCVKQQQAGIINIVSDGEQTRYKHFVTTFIAHLNGVDFEKRKTVKIVIVMTQASLRFSSCSQKPVFVKDAKFLRQQTDSAD